MENFLVNHNGKLIEVTPIIKDPEAMLVVSLEDKETLWVDVTNGSVKEDAPEVIGID